MNNSSKKKDRRIYCYYSDSLYQCICIINLLPKNRAQNIFFGIASGKFRNKTFMCLYSFVVSALSFASVDLDLIPPESSTKQVATIWLSTLVNKPSHFVVDVQWCQLSIHCSWTRSLLDRNNLFRMNPVVSRHAHRGKRLVHQKLDQYYGCHLYSLSMMPPNKTFQPSRLFSRRRKR